MRARYVEVMKLARSVKDAQEYYHMANGSYTLDFEQILDRLPPGAGTSTSPDIGPGVAWPDGRECFITLAQGGFLSCRHFSKTQAAYVIYLDGAVSNDKQACFAYDVDRKSLPNLLCKSFGGEESKAFSNGISYRLP